ncbi:MAG TPA: 2-amino-4-hydroxy-6-hydroxymethyldihydropteridine diphosphokinase [Cyclobacteriaceae bacterium]
MRKRIFLLLGSNIGEPAANLNFAHREIGVRIGRIEKASSVYQTAPWGITNQPDFLNQVVMTDTAKDPYRVLDCITGIERTMGRERTQKWGARIIDIDILLYDQLIVHDAVLDIPHPGIPFRRFTLVPLAEIAPDVVHPELQKSIAALLSECEDPSDVKKILL